MFWSGISLFSSFMKISMTLTLNNTQTYSLNPNTTFLTLSFLSYCPQLLIFLLSFTYSPFLPLISSLSFSMTSLLSLFLSPFLFPSVILSIQISHQKEKVLCISIRMCMGLLVIETIFLCCSSRLDKSNSWTLLLIHF